MTSPIEQAVADALAAHEPYFFDEINGLACDCGEDISSGSTQSDADRHRVNAIMAAIDSVLKQEGTTS